MKAKRQNKECAESISNVCISWEAGDVPCLGICTGDSLAEAEKIIADKVCELVDDLDLSKVDISCAIQRADALQDKSLKSILQILFDNQCTLKQLINSFSSTSTAPVININLRCLKVFDAFNNEIPQDLNQSLQTIVNQVCSTVTDVSSLKSRVGILETTVASIPTTPQITPETQITTCLSPGLRPISQVVPVVANAICSINTALGSAEKLNSAISQQCANLNSEYQTAPGWNLVVSNLADSVSNMWTVLCDLKARIKTIEDNCCALTCADIKMGFEVIPNTLQNGISLKFSEKSGVVIPLGFVDCGSTVTITDASGTVVSYTLAVSAGATVGEFDLSGLDLSQNILIDLDAKFCSPTLTCEKCVSKIYKLDSGSCPYCPIVVTGDPGTEVIIVYTV